MQFQVNQSFFVFNTLQVSCLKLQQELPNIYELTDETFNEALEKFEMLFVKFYARKKNKNILQPNINFIKKAWCTHCKEFAPEFNKAAEIMQFRAIQVPFANVDATQQQKIAIQYNVEYYPTIIFLIAGKAIKYEAERTSTAVVQ